MADLSGITLGQYTLQHRIGKGGMADVYRARQESMGRDVAVKVMSTALSENPEFVARFEREARVIARLQHPHILPVIDFGRQDEYTYLVMRVVDGGILSDRMRAGSLSVEQINHLLQQMAAALEYAHRSGVVHRDLKPANVLLDDTDNAYLTDFGIAKMISDASTGAANLTATGQVMGTPAYMAPEQWRSEAVDARTDIYALGVILYEMLLGALPFNADTPYSMMYKHFDAPPPPPRAINPDLPAAVEGVLLRALQKSPENRYPSAKVFADEFAQGIKGLPPQMLAIDLPRATPEQIEHATTPAAIAPSVTPPTGWRPPAPDAAPHDAATPQPGRIAPPAQITPPQYASPQYASPEHAAPATHRSAHLPRWLVALALAGILAAAAIVIGLFIRESDDPAPTPGRTPTIASLLVTQPAALGAGEPITRSAIIPTATTGFGAPPTATQRPLAFAPPQTEGETPADDTLPDTAEDPIAEEPAAEDPAATIPTATEYNQPPSIAPTSEPATGADDTPYAAQSAKDTCDSMESRLAPGEGARTTLIPAANTSVRIGPGLDEFVVRAIPPGQMFGVTGGPACADGIWWWEIEGVDESGLWSGWIGEGSDGVYWIEPWETGPIDCPGAPLPRLIPGEQGRITLFPAIPSRIRTTAGVAGRVLGQLNPGTTFDVISGPVCDSDNALRWWLVRSARFEGWIAEGPAGEYWLEPYQGAYN